MDHWNEQRHLAVERALNKILYPQLIKELKNKLLEEATQRIIRVSHAFLRAFHEELRRNAFR